MNRKFMLYIKWILEKNWNNLTYFQLVVIMVLICGLYVLFFIIPVDFKNYTNLKKGNAELVEFKIIEPENRHEQKNVKINSKFYSDILPIISINDVVLINYKEIKKENFFEYNLSVNGTWLNSRKFIDQFIKKFPDIKIVTLKIERNIDDNSILTTLVLRGEHE
ncbi:hypothetical protein ASC84_19955 [Acinetobacter sp. Root1280]|uniref:hypothetical protein n=1 Tax=Acinetobacter sp. Root1280 TaxID=1736444 RepID=UPI0006FEE4DF|nr:hypothetical protein [Acinetobacter sp. Root1280]KQW99766.1 hypothetical protein ASC84_19955 [Acinetobacter sp. Root1280]